MSISERRFESRFLCADLVSVVWSDVVWSDAANPEKGHAQELSGAQTACAVLEDISAPGACVQLEQPIPVGAPITLIIGESRFGGRVSYSVFRDYGYFVGIRFSEGTAWSADTVMPQHLTNLETLAHLADCQD